MHLLMTYSSKVIVKRRWRNFVTICNVLWVLNNYKRFQGRKVFLEVIIIVKEFNQLPNIVKICQSMTIRTSIIQVHLKHYEGESNSDVHTCTRICIQFIYDLSYFSLLYSCCWLLIIFVCSKLCLDHLSLYDRSNPPLFIFAVYMVVVFLCLYVLFVWNVYVYVICLCISCFNHSIITCINLI